MFRIQEYLEFSWEAPKGQRTSQRSTQRGSRQSLVLVFRDMQETGNYETQPGRAHLTSSALLRAFFLGIVAAVRLSLTT